MTTREITDEIVAWADQLIPELEYAFNHATDEHGGLPDIAVEVTGINFTTAPVEGRLAKLQQIEQTRTKIWDLEVILVVPPDPAQDAENMLKDFSDRLLDDFLVPAGNIRSRFAWVNDTPRVSFRPPLVEFEDGTRGRIVTLFMQVGQQVEV